MEEEIKATELQQELNQALEELSFALENLKQELTLLEEFNHRIEDKYGPDFLALVQGLPVEQPVKVVKKVCRIFNKQGDLLSVLTEKYIKKRDGTTVLLTVDAR